MAMTFLHAMRRLLPLLWVLVCACTPARREVQGNIVRDIAFEGNGGLLSGHNDLQLQQAMQQDDSPFGVLLWPLTYFVSPSALDEDNFPSDAYRLEVWYAHHGWFDAQVRGFAMRRIRDMTERRAGVIDIVGYVEPGEPSEVRSLRIEGLEGQLEALGTAALLGAPIREGDQFDLDAVEDTRAELVERLQNSAYAYARVDLDIRAHPEEHAVDVVLKAEPGVVAKFGEIDIVGNSRIPDHFIEEVLTRPGSINELAPGVRYSVRAMRRVQQRLFDMNTFSIVTIEPDLSDPQQQRIPVVVRVTESRFRTLRLGVGGEYDGFQLSPHVSARFRHTNLFSNLVRFEAGAQVGFAYTVTGDERDSAGMPTYLFDTRLTYPRLFEQRLAIELDASIEQDVYSGLWRFRRPEADLHGVWAWNDYITVRAGPHVEQYAFLGEFTEEQQAAQQRLFGIEGSEDFTYELTALDQYVTWDYRDREKPWLTRRGSYYALELREAFPLTTDGYFFVSGVLDARRYLPIRFGDRLRGHQTTLVLRGRGQVVQPIGDTTIPLPERAFLGGPSSIRGFRPNQVGPYETICTYTTVSSGGGLLGNLFGDNEETEEGRVYRDHVPIGGNVAMEGTVEARYDLIYDLRLATFVDAGILSPGWDELSFDDFRWSAGVGLRYDTVVGPLRFDVSARPLYPEDEGPESFLFCEPEDQETRPFDLFSTFESLRGDNHPPFALVFFVTLGEAL